MCVTFHITDTARIECRAQVDAEDIAPFDEIQMVLVIDGTEHVLYSDDYAIEAARSLFNVLASIIQGKLGLSDEVRSVGIGQWWAYYVARDMELPRLNNLAGPYDVWATVNEIGNQTWMYSVDGVAFLEVTPIYVWAFEEPDVPGYVSLEEFMRNYETKAKFEIEPNRLCEWRETCQEWLSSMESLIEEGRYTTSTGSQD
jgi:hypothetical protein